MTTFNIGTQRASTINNVGGDMTVPGGDGWDRAAFTAELRRLELGLAQLRLPAGGRLAVEQALAATAAEPDPERVAERLSCITRTLAEAGALTTAAVGVVDGLRRVGATLGPAGKGLLALLSIAV